MNNNSFFEITSKQLIFVIVGATIGSGLLTIPRQITELSGQNGWICILFGALVPLAYLYLISVIYKRHPNQTLSDLLTANFGKYIGSLFIITFFLYIVAFEGIVARIACEIVSLYLLPNTPLYIIILLYMLAVYYIMSMGLKVIGRLNELIFYILLPVLIIFFIPIPLGNFTNILPIANTDIYSLAKCSLTTGYYFQGIEILLVIYPLVTQKNKIFKSGIIAIALITMQFLIVSISCILVFSPDVTQRLLIPGISLLKVANIPVLERLDTLFLILWLPFVLKPVITSGFCGAYSLSKLFNTNAKKYYFLCVTITCILIYIMSLIPQGFVQALEFSSYLGYTFLIVGLFYPLIIYFGSKIRK